MHRKTKKQALNELSIHSTCPHCSTKNMFIIKSSLLTKGAKRKCQACSGKFWVYRGEVVGSEKQDPNKGGIEPRLKGSRR